MVVCVRGRGHQFACSVNNSICINRFHMCIGSTHRHIGAKFNGTRWHMLVVVVVVGACNWSHQTNWRGQTVGQVGRCLQYVFRYLLHACESKNSAESTASCLSLSLHLSHSLCVPLSRGDWLCRCFSNSSLSYQMQSTMVRMSVHTRSEYEYSHFSLWIRPCSSSSSKQNRKNDSSLIHFYLRSTVPLPIKILRGLTEPKKESESLRGRVRE